MDKNEDGLPEPKNPSAPEGPATSALDGLFEGMPDTGESFNSARPPHLDFLRHLDIPVLNGSSFDVQNIELDDSSQRTAEHTAQMAAYTEAMARHIRQLADLTQQSLQLSEQARRDSAQAERFSRRMSLSSFWVSIASLAAAMGSIVIAIVALSAQAN